MATAIPKESACNLVKIEPLKLEKDNLFVIALVVSGDFLIVTDRNSWKVLLYRHWDRKLLATTDRMESEPRGICFINNMEICVTVGNKIEIMSVQCTGDTGAITRCRTLHQNTTFDYFSRVVKSMDKVVVCGRHKEYMICWFTVSLDGPHLDTVHHVSKGLWSYMTAKHNMIYISCRANRDSPDNGVYGYDIDNPSKQAFICKHKNLTWPTGITVDTMGFVFVGNYFPSCVDLLTNKCELVTVFREGMPRNRLCDLFWDHGLLYVTREWSKVVNRYKTEYPLQGDHEASQVLGTQQITETEGAIDEMSSETEEEVLPPEILNMDESFQKLYREVLATGKEKVYNIRVMIVGNQGVGKTSLTQRLLGQQVEEIETESTEGIEVHARCCQIDHATRKWKRKIKTDELFLNDQRIASILHKYTSPQNNQDIKETDPENDISPARKQRLPLHSETIVLSPVHGDPGSFHNEASLGPISKGAGHVTEADGDIAASQIDKTGQTGNGLDEAERMIYPEEIQTFVERVQSLPFPKSRSSDVTLLDFAGQTVFYTTHQAFMSWRTLYLLVTDMSLPLTDVVKEIVLSDMSGTRVCRIQEYVTYWLNSIHSHVLKPGDDWMRREEKGGGVQASTRNHPFVILVGTHSDKIPKELLDQKKRTYFNDIRIFLKNSPLLVHLVDEDFAISNLGLDPTINALKSKIFDVAQKQVYWGEEIPARWIPLERALIELKNKGVPVMDYDDVKSLNKNLQVRIELQEELDLFLRFEHDIGNIVFFNTERLKKKVVLDPEWLIHGVRTWITSDQILRKHPELTEQWDTFKNTGRLTSPILGDSNLKQLSGLLNLPNLFLLCVPGAKLVGDITNFKSKVLDVVRAEKPDLLILHIGSNDVGKDVNIFTSCYRDLIHLLLETSPTMLISVCGILPRTTSNFKSLHWNLTVLPDLQRGCAALNDGIISLSRECDKCQFIDYNPLFDISMHLARDGLHVNRNGAYVLKTVLESFVVSVDMEQITSADTFLSSDLCHLVDTRMSYADVVKQFPPREKLVSIDYKYKESCIVSKKWFVPKFSRQKRYRVPVSKQVKKSHRARISSQERLEQHEILVNVSEDVAVILPPTALHNIYKDRHIHAASTHQKPKLKRFIQKIIPAKVFCCPECPVKCTKENFLLDHYLSRHAPHRKKKEEIMCKDASFKQKHMKDEIITCKASSQRSSITNSQFIALDVHGMQLFGMKCEQRDKKDPTVLSSCMSFVKRIASFCWKNFARMKLILSGDVEENPGPPVIQCSWESCTETFQTKQLLGQHVIGHIHPGMLCQWKDCVFTSYDGNELETHVLKHIYLEQFSFHSIEEWEEALPLGQLSTITTDLHLCPVPLRSKLHLLLLDEDFRMPPKYPYIIEHHSQYLSMLNSFNACEFEKQTADFICKRQLLGENWTTDDSIEVITPMSNSLLQETSLHPTDSNNKTLSRKRKSDLSEVSIPKNVFTANLEKCHKAIYIEYDIISQLLECHFMDSKNKQLQQFEDAAINIATFPNCTEGVFIFTLLKIINGISEVPFYYMRYIESGYYKNFMVEKFLDLICEKLTISKESLFLCNIATDEDKKIIAQRKMKGSHKSPSRPDRVYNYNLSSLKERKLKLAEHAENFTNLDLCACFVLTIRKGFTVKICTNVSDAYYMSCDNDMLKTPAIRDIVCHYPEIRIIDRFEKSSVDFLKSFASVESLYEQSVMLNLLSNDHGIDIIKFRYRFSNCSSAKSLRNKALYLYKNKQFGELFKMYTDLCHENDHNNSASEHIVYHAEPVPKCRKMFTPRGKIVTAEMVLKTVDIKNENVMKDISIYDNFKKQLLEYGDLVIQVFDEHKLIAVMNDYDDETGEFKKSEYVTTTREQFENGMFYTCTCRIYCTLLECFSDRGQEQYDALDINGIKCMHCRVLKEDIYPNIERDESAAITNIQAVIQRSLSFNDRTIVELSSCRPNTKKFSVMHDDEISFVHLTFSARVQRFIISCTNGYCRNKKGFKRNVDLLTKGGNLCSHLLELKNAPQFWMEFSNCLFNDTADDLQTEAFPEIIDVEMNIENQFSTGNDSNFNVDDGLWSFPCVSTHSARKQQDSKLAKNIRERYIWITSDFSNIENGCVKGPDLVNEIPEFPCRCGAGWTDLDHLNGKTVFDRTLTIYIKIAPVQCRVLTRMCVKTEAPCQIKWDEGQSLCIHVATRDTAAGDEIGWAFVNQVLGSKVTFSSFCDLKTKDYRESNPDFRSFMDQVVFRKWWFSWASNMKIDFRKPCPVCGFAPKQLACDGTKVGVGFRNANFEEISKPDDPDNILPTLHRRMTRCFLPDRPGINKDNLKQAREHLHYISRVILNEIPRQEILPHEEQLNRNTLLLSLLCNSVKPVFRRFLAQMSEFENIFPDENIAFANVVKMLATTAPIISLIPHAYLDCIVELLDHMTGEKVNNGGDLFFNRKMQEMREYSPEIRDMIATSMLGNTNENGEDCIRQDVVDFIRYLITQVSEITVTPAELALPQFGTYNPPKFGRAYYFSESGKKLRSVRKFSIDCERKTTLAYDDPPLEHDRCEKYFSKTHISAPGTSSLFLWFCPNHGHCYGFHMTNAEGRKDPSASIYSHLQTPPKNIFYDFACNLHEYCLNRESGFFRDVRFFHDIFHGFAHKCSCAYRSSRLIGFDSINSSICEQFNSFIQCIKSSARQMTQEHFCFYLQFFIHEWNVRKRERYQKQMAVALAGV